MKDNENIVYINAQILDSDVCQTTHSSANSNEINRAYEIWRHSESLIHGEADKFELSDGIANLKRCINHRIKLIESTYHFRHTFPNKPNKPKSGDLELLGEIGLVRPYLIKHLFVIRNNIEHLDHNPPEASRCTELLDITWYLLKSTDSLLFNIPEEWDLSNPDIPGFNIEIKWRREDVLVPFITGWIPIVLRSDRDDGKILEVRCEEIHKKCEGSFPEINSKRNETDIYINGQISMESGLSKSLVRALLL